MHTIGEFSRICKVPVKTLRYYDEIGLLKPAHVDPDSGYRLYAPAQVTRVQRLLALKDLGLSLAQITEYLDGKPSVDELRGMLRLRHAQLEEEIQQARSRLDAVEAHEMRLNEGVEPSFDVVAKDVDSLLVASIRRTLPNALDQETLWDELSDAMRTAACSPTGPPMALHHDPDFREANMDVEVAIPVDCETPLDGAATIREIPGVRVASIIHHGPDAKLVTAYHRIVMWILSHGYRLHTPSREVYLRYADTRREPIPAMKHMITQHPDDALTEVQLPISRPTA